MKWSIQYSLLCDRNLNSEKMPLSKTVLDFCVSYGHTYSYDNLENHNEKKRKR